MPEQSNGRSQAGKILGSAHSESKSRAARQNGKKGGRPVGSATGSRGKSQIKKDEDSK